ncbi:hypothetical protein NM688_g6981 [Phlebia brevispora]|uniref:Uncharacterized protein n=1 Tax=Phlebia brevispora TaxID=194682 RepID=A0ACC1SAI2_9APHY|nr:hypothetical protein NM688_g6981 [Phlebia brevispora]
MAALTLQPISVPSQCIFHDVPETRREDMSEFALAQATHDELLVAQLGRLASQHHSSEYNRVKFGRNGASTTYVPLCLHMPEHFEQLRRQQARYARMQAWWPCPQNDGPQQTPSTAPRTRSSREPPIRWPSGTTDLQHDLFSAMASPFALPMKTAPQLVHTLVKTSETHPINISSMIPVELLPIISAHISQADHLSPVMFNVPLPFQLHRLISQSADASSVIQGAPNRVLDSVGLKGGMTSSTPSRSASLADLFWNQKLLCSTLVPAVSGPKMQSNKPQRNSIMSFPPLRPRTAPRSSHAIPANRPTSSFFPNPTLPSCCAVPEESQMFSSCKTEMQIECADDDPLHWRSITSYISPLDNSQIPKLRSNQSVKSAADRHHGITYLELS